MTLEEHLISQYWTMYESYMARKEHLIEAVATLYVAGAGALLLQDWTNFWRVHYPAVMVLGLFGAALVMWFVLEQFQMWREGALLSTAAQSVLALWAAGGPRNVALAPLPGSGVPAPHDLVTEMAHPTQLAGAVRHKPRRSFAITALGFVAMATVALAVQSVWAWCKH